MAVPVWCLACGSKGKGKLLPRAQGQRWVWALHEVGCPHASPSGAAEDALQVPSCLSLPAPGLSLPAVTSWRMGGVRSGRGSCPPRPHRLAGAGVGGPAVPAQPVPLPHEPVMGWASGLAWD